MAQDLDWTYAFMATPEQFARSLLNCVACRQCHAFVHGHIWSEQQMQLFNGLKWLGLHRVPIELLSSSAIADPPNLTPATDHRDCKTTKLSPADHQV